ncbi:hypothetical protein GCM10027275_03910 [Rhabdobacter roseus]|uniref:DNA-binding beta-propeller fold protein YncE n=1 Tax=Rhabdobacter roseus TaxID=1655419 RepID=A0A840TQF4_9BACT|nr:DUF5074 domain-containing protein [Rhabdobacter roseus]MBB5282280.1 DNA-binding beta-propeller fold protein YncE [Rhabdobacter roseus]
MKKQLTRFLAVVLLTSAVWSCRERETLPDGDYARGVLVVNEGLWGSNNGSISFFKREDREAQLDVFEKENGISLNGGAQSLAEGHGHALIMVDLRNAGLDKVEIVNSNTFKRIGTLTAPDIENPRYGLVVSETKAYVTCWGTTGTFPNFYINPGYVAVVDLTTQRVTKKIPVAKGAERLVAAGQRLYVGNAAEVSGLTVINMATDEVVSTLTTAASPNPIGVDADNKLWAYAGLNLYKINPSSGTIESTLPIGNNPTKSAGSFAFSPDRRTLYFVLSAYDANWNAIGETYQFATNATQVNVSTPFVRRLFSGLAVDPMQGLIYAGVTPSYAQSGYVVRYRPDGSLVDSIRAEIGPKEFIFK